MTIRGDLLALRREVENIYIGVAALPIIYRQEGDGVESKVVNLINRWDELNRLLASVSHRLPSTGVKIPTPLLDEDERPSACDGACALLFALKICFDSLSKKGSFSWTKHTLGQVYADLSKTAVSEVNEALRVLDAEQLQTIGQETITLRELFGLVKSHSTRPALETVRGWAKRPDFPKSLGGTKDKTYSKVSVFEWCRANKGINLGEM